jgi:hypothetical protein
MTRAAIATFLGLCLCVLNASGQAIPAGRAGRASASIGYSYVNAPLDGSGRASLNGLDAGMAFRVRPRFGIEGDVGYVRSGNPVGIPGHSDIFSYMGGPLFYLSDRGRIQTTAHVLLGGARVSAPIAVSGGTLIGGWATGFAWATGGAVDYRFSKRFAVRASLDYLSTTYFGPSLALQRQSNVGFGVALVYLFGNSNGRRQR